MEGVGFKVLGGLGGCLYMYLSNLRSSSKRLMDCAGEGVASGFGHRLGIARTSLTSKGACEHFLMLFCMWQFPKIRGPQYRPQNTIGLIIGAPKMVPLILGNPHVNVPICKDP